MRCRGIVNHLAPDGSQVTAIICGRRETKRCVVCRGGASLLCDWPLKGAKAGETCSRGLCAAHTYRPTDGVDYCPAHAEVHRQLVDALKAGLAAGGPR
jgi:hypothetical protein